LARLTAPTPEFLRFLYAAVGEPYHWTDRLVWTPPQWAERLADPAVEVWVAWDGGAPAGYFELCHQPDGTVELAYFGLLPHAVGQGQGGPLLSAAVSRAWEMGAERVYVNSCSLDHPSAMANYAARGFHVFREEVKEKDVAA
jgi:GNAT superfamily N-acetyltransferase